MAEENRILVYRHDERMRALEQRLTGVEHELGKIREDLGRLQWWLVALLGGVTTSLILMLIDIAMRRS